MKGQTSDKATKEGLGNVWKEFDSLRGEINALIEVDGELMKRLECVTVPDTPKEDAKIQEDVNANANANASDLAGQLHEMEIVILRETRKVQDQINRLDI